MMNEYINDDPLGRGPKPPQHHNLSPPPPRDTAFQVQALPKDVGPMFPDATFEGGRMENAPMQQQHQHYNNMPPRLQQQQRDDMHNYIDYRQPPPQSLRSPPPPHRSPYNHTHHTSNESIPPSPMEIYMTTQDVHPQYQTNNAQQYHDEGINNNNSSGYPRHVQADERRDLPPPSPLTDMGPYGGGEGDDRRSADPLSYYPPPSRYSNNERITPLYHNHHRIHQQQRISEYFPHDRSKRSQMSTRSEPNQYQRSRQQQTHPRLIKSESETIHHRNNNYNTMNGYNNNNSSRRGGGRYDDDSRRRSHEPYNLDTLCCGEEYRYNDNVHNQQQYQRRDTHNNVRHNDDLYRREYERYKRTSPRYKNHTNTTTDPTGPLSPLSIPSCVIGPSPYDDDSTEAACASTSSTRENRRPRPHQQGYYSSNNTNHHQYPPSYYTEEERDSNYHDGMINKQHVPSQVAVVYPTNNNECVPGTPPRDHYYSNSNSNTSPMRRDERRDDYSGSSTIYTSSSNYNTPSPPQHHMHMQQQQQNISGMSRQYQHQQTPLSNKYDDYNIQRNDQHYTQQQHRGVIESNLLSVDIPPPPPPPYPPPHQTSTNRPNNGRPPPHNNTNQLSSSYKQQQQRNIGGTLGNLVCGTNPNSLNAPTPIAIATSSNSTNNNNNSQYANNERLKSQARHQILKEISAATNMRNSATSSKDVNFWNVQIKTLNDSFKKL